MVNKYHVAQSLGAAQALKRAGAFGGFAKVALQRRRQHVLNQTGFARAADAGHGDQSLQRKGDGDVFQVVLAHAFQHQARCAVLHLAGKGGTDALAPAQILAGQRVGAAQRLGRAVKDDAPAALAGAGAKVQHAVGGQHHRRVVLDHHQRVAGTLQAQHGFGDAVHVARVQADAWLVQHKQRVDQRGAQRRGQVDALHLATRQRAALPVQRQVANADVAQILQPRADFGVQ